MWALRVHNVGKTAILVRISTSQRALECKWLSLRRFLSKHRTASYCLGMYRYRKDRLWQQVMKLTKLISEADR